METNAELFATIQIDEAIDFCNAHAPLTGRWLEQNRADLIADGAESLLDNSADNRAA